MEAGIAALAALIPDLDCRRSYVGRMIRPLSAWLEDSFGHRTLTHSLLAQALVGAASFLLLPFGYFLAFTSGWVSHSILDMMTTSGVCWFWPNRARCVIPGNARYRMESMGKGELWFLIIMGLIGILLMPLAATGQNTTGLIRSAIGNIVTARQDYDARKGEHAFYLEVKGRDNRSYTNISGRYYVIGPHLETGFLLETDQGTRSACQGSGCDWYTESAVLEKGDPEATTTFPIHIKHISGADLIAALKPANSNGRVYLIGKAHAKNVPAMPPTLTVSGDEIRFSYAGIEKLEALASKTLRDVSLSVQIRHAPGNTIEEIVLPEDQQPRTLDASLNRWLPPTQ